MDPHLHDSSHNLPNSQRSHRSEPLSWSFMYFASTASPSTMPSTASSNPPRNTNETDFDEKENYEDLSGLNDREMETDTDRCDKLLQS